MPRRRRSPSLVKGLARAWRERKVEPPAGTKSLYLFSTGCCQQPILNVPVPFSGGWATLAGTKLALSRCLAASVAHFSAGWWP